MSAANVQNQHIVPGKLFKDGNNVYYALVGIQDQTKNNQYFYYLISNSTFLALHTAPMEFNQVLSYCQSKGLSNTT